MWLGREKQPDLRQVRVYFNSHKKDGFEGSQNLVSL